MASGGLACFVLQKAYLHIYLPKPSGVDQKLLLVHCDPQESKDSIHYRYKIAPHLHFEMAPCPWNETHIPLCDGWQETILQSLDNLDKAIARAIEFIADELLPLSRTTY
jgi:hypothetical protein